MHRIVAMVVAHLIVMCIFCLWWFSLFLADLCLVVICLFVCSQALVVASYHVLLTLLIWQPAIAVNQGRRSRWFIIRLVNNQLGETGNCFRHKMYMCILYLRCEDTILVILCSTLPITTTIAGEWFNSKYSMTISNVLQLMDRQLFILRLIIFIMWRSFILHKIFLESTELCN